MDPVREMEILNLDQWRQEEAARGREGLLEQVMGWLCILALIGAIMVAGILGGGKMVGAW